MLAETCRCTLAAIRAEESLLAAQSAVA